MSKKKKDKNISKPLNFVAKHMNTFNRAETYRDRKNDYRRNEKHRSKYDASPLDILTSCVLNILFTIHFQGRNCYG